MSDDPSRKQEADWDQAVSFVPTGCVEVSCEGVTFTATRCSSDERELILWLYKVESPGIQLLNQPVQWYTSQMDFHVVGRDGVPGKPWVSKAGPGYRWEGIEDPEAHEKKAYGEQFDRVRRAGNRVEVKRRCFCCKCSEMKIK